MSEFVFGIKLESSDFREHDAVYEILSEALRRATERGDLKEVKVRDIRYLPFPNGKIPNMEKK